MSVSWNEVMGMGFMQRSFMGIGFMGIGFMKMSFLRMSVSGAILILMIVLVRSLLINRLPKKTFLILWGVSLIRLLIPFSLPFMGSIYTLVQRNEPVMDTVRQIPVGDFLPLESGGMVSGEEPEAAGGEVPGVVTEAAFGVVPEAAAGEALGVGNEAVPGVVSEAVSGETSGTGNETVSGEEPEAVLGAASKAKQVVLDLLDRAGENASLWTAVWGIGALICLGFFSFAYIKCYREFQTSLPVDNETVRAWYPSHPLRRRLSIRQSSQVTAPLSYGILRPVILMPKETDWTDTRQLSYILEHEYVHIRRLDGLVKLVMVAALCIHWFNPLVWVMYILFNRDIELSCDETVVRRFGESTKSAYAMTLIYMEEAKSGLAPLYNSFSKNAVEERIRAIMKIRKTTAATSILAAVLVISITSAFATSAAMPEEERIEADVDGKNEMKTDAAGQNDAETEYPAEKQGAESGGNQTKIGATAVGYDMEAITARMAELDLLIDQAAVENPGELEAAMEEKETLMCMLEDMERQTFFDTTYGAYGVSYRLPENRLYKDGKLVMGFRDDQNGGNLWWDNEGEIYVEVIRNNSGEILRLFEEAEDHALVRDLVSNISQDEHFPEYEKFGISYDERYGYLMYDGKTVGYFKDQIEPGIVRRYSDPTGELGIVVIRNEAGEIIALQVDPISPINTSRTMAP